jgi:hypothetical protein
MTFNVINVIMLRVVLRVSWCPLDTDMLFNFNIAKNQTTLVNSATAKDRETKASIRNDQKFADACLTKFKTIKFYIINFATY